MKTLKGERGGGAKERTTRQKELSQAENNPCKHSYYHLQVPKQIELLQLPSHNNNNTSTEFYLVFSLYIMHASPYSYKIHFWSFMAFTGDSKARLSKRMGESQRGRLAEMARGRGLASGRYARAWTAPWVPCSDPTD